MRFKPVTISGRLHFLDALRGLAAVAVMLFHFFDKDVSPIHNELAASLPTWLARSVQELYCGVAIFFVLSGFVIAFSMDGQAASLRYAGNFILRRSLRLDPPYWAAMALMIGYYLLRWPAKWHDFYLMFGGLPGLAANLFYVQNVPWFYPANSVLDVSWTLCLEVQFYLSFLLILVAGHYAGLLAGRHAAFCHRAIVVLSVTALAAGSLWIWVQQPNDAFSGRAWAFFLGVAVYGMLTRGVPPIAVLGCLSVLGALFVWKQELESLTTVVTAGLIYSAGITGRASTLLAWRPLLHLGKISYSIYLLHMVIGLNLLYSMSPFISGSVPAAWIAVAAAIVLSLVGAELLHRAVEAPSNRLSQLLKRPRLHKRL